MRSRIVQGFGGGILGMCLTLAVSGPCRAQQCVGDCNGNGVVTVDELITGVGIALGSQPMSACEAFDCQGNGTMPINCLVQGVNSALNGCSVTPTATPTPSATATATPTKTLTPTVTLTSTPCPTATATATATDTVTPTPTPPVALILVDDVSGAPGDVAELSVSLRSRGDVAGTENEINFVSGEFNIEALSDGTPDCTVNPDIEKNDAVFIFLPVGCIPGSMCTGIRADVFSQGNEAAIADGSVLYTCRIDIALSARTGDYPVIVANPLASGPNALPLSSAGRNSMVHIQVSLDFIFAGDVSGAPDEIVELSVGLRSRGDVATTENEINFVPGVFGIAARVADGTPICTVNATIDKSDAVFAFLPLGCDPGSTCTGIKADVFSRSNERAIADGSVLYTCLIGIAATAGAGEYPVTIGNLLASGPNGLPVSSASRDGMVHVRVGLDFIFAGDVSGAPGDLVRLSVSLRTHGDVANAENDITFVPGVFDIEALPDGRPNCTVNPDIGKNSTVFAFLPFGCIPGSTCTGIRAEVPSLFDGTPIADASVLYICVIRIAANANEGIYELVIANPAASDPNGSTVAITDLGGAVHVTTRRFIDNGDGTITDGQTGLIWEKKDRGGGVHDVNNTYVWAGSCSDGSEECQPDVAAAATCTAATGGAFGCAQCGDAATCNTFGFTTIWEWLSQLNAANFAGHNDWRIPTVGQDGGTTQLETIVNTNVPGCGGGAPCVPPAFNTGCTAECTVTSCSCAKAFYYWSATTRSGSPSDAWLVFTTGGLLVNVKLDRDYVRAVRGGS